MTLPTPKEAKQGKPDEKLLTAQELAEKLRVSIWTVRRHSRGKHPKIPCIRLGHRKGSAPRYDWHTVLRALAKGALVIFIVGLVNGAAGEPQTGPGMGAFIATRETSHFQSVSSAQGDPATRKHPIVSSFKSRGLNPFATPEPLSSNGNKSKPYEEMADPVMISARPNAPSGVATLLGERHRGKPTSSGEHVSLSASCASWFNPPGARLSILGAISVVYGVLVLGTLFVAAVEVVRTNK